MPVAATHAEVVCPFCALLCDDLDVAAEGTALRVTAKGCPRAVESFARPLPAEPTPLVDTASATLEAALARAAAILRAAKAPLIGGLGTDTAGLRAALRLAEATGAVLDHAHGAGLGANLLALQTGGWVTATLAEARNRPDLVLLVGGDGGASAPRLFERVLRPPSTLDPERGAARRIVQLGGAPSAWPGIAHLPCAPEDLLGTVGLLRALVAGRPLAAPAALVELAAALRSAAYALIVWSAGSLPEPAATVAHLAELTKALNTEGRAAGLPLAAGDNATGANQVATWQTGVPLPLSLAAGVPDHDPVRWRAQALLARGGADALLWISTFSDIAPPPGDVPTVLLVRAGFVPAAVPAVLIPVGTPGLDHPGSVYRTDGIAALPLRALRPSPLPTTAEVLTRLAAMLGT
jgi:formylmethanofuran dehydrogenase subunit B